MSFRDIPTRDTALRDFLRSILRRVYLLERHITAGGVYVPSGLIAKYGGSAAPAGWVLCDGSSYNGNQPPYALLWSVIGTTYGGTGIASFHVPTITGTNPINIIKL